MAAAAAIAAVGRETLQEGGTCRVSRRVATSHVVLLRHNIDARGAAGTRNVAADAVGRFTSDQRHSDAGHVGETAVVPLECDGHCRGRAIAVFGYYQVRLASPGRLLLVGILTMQQDDDIRVLLDAVVD